MLTILSWRRFTCILSLSSAALSAHAQLEEVIVSAQKRAEAVQDVPIAITAFDMAAMKAKQITGFQDLRYTTPNVTTQKSNFSRFNFQIRGIGRTLVAASGDAGVGIHVNEAPILSARLFETEYYDVQTLEILRGPQGTLYGRNSTGGVVNMNTARAQLDNLDGNIEAQIGDYAHNKFTGHINIPLGERLAVRLAGLWLEREGYTENLHFGTDIDGRDQYSVRGSLAWEPSEQTRIDLMISSFDEDSNRTRSQKVMCKNEPTGLLGCSPDALDFDYAHPSSQITQLLAGTHVLGPFGLYEFGSNTRASNTPDLREVESDFDPTYLADETLVTLNVSHEMDLHNLAFVASYQDTSVESEQDATWNVAIPVELSPLLAVIAPQNYASFWAEGLLPISAASATGTGSIGGHEKFRSPGIDAYNHSALNSEQYTLEFRIASNYSGNFNWLAGGFYMDVEQADEYFVFATAFDYLAALRPVLETGQDGYGQVAPNFLSESDSYSLKSAGLFGEIYYELREDMKLSLGLRYTEDEKKVASRQLLLNENADTGEILVQPVGADLPIPVPYDDFADQWDEITGRLVLDWNYADNRMAFFSYSRGYKGGGFNPAFNPIDFPFTSTSFEPEFVNAFEIGSKNTFLDGSLRANGSMFFYDYEGLQISKIINRTAFNGNTDAEIFGIEAELVWAPSQRWLFNGNFAYLKTEVKKFSDVDPRDPADGRSDLTLVKDQILSTNCVVDMAPRDFAALGQAQFNSCAGLIAAGFSVSDGAAIDLSGNALQNSPEYSFSLGAQYTFTLPQNHTLDLRVDYYWQDDMYARNFNKPIDKIDSWDVWSAQANLMSADGSWYIRAYVKNIADEDHLVGMHLAGASSGNFTNVFAIEPRTYGIALGYNWN